MGHFSNVWEPAGDVVPAVRAQTFLVEETQYATAGQRTFNLTRFTYVPGSGTLRVYINGARVTGIIEDTDSSFTLPAGCACAADNKVFIEALLEEVSAATSMMEHTAFTATEGQTVFTVNNVPAKSFVFRNGASLSYPVDYASTGLTVTLTDACAEGDIIDVYAFATMKLVDTVASADLANQTDPLKGAGLVGYKGRTQADKNAEFVSLGDYQHLISGGDYTAAAQAAINAAASTLRAVDFSGFASISVMSLSLPSNTELRLGTSTLKRANGSNQPLLKNASIGYASGVYGNTNIKIIGGSLDFNGSNQSDTGTDGAWLVGAKFAGVRGLEFHGVTVKNSRRFNLFICNCTKIRAYGTEIINDPAIPSANKDGFHINGKVSDFYADVITVHNSEDDAIALNADDIDFGGDMTVANISGPIDDIKVGMIKCIDTRNGVRLLSATKRIRNVQIDSITGNVSVYALNLQDYGLGASSWYQNIKIGTVDCVFDARAYPEANMAMVNIEIPNHSTNTYSNIEIGSIHRWQNDVDGQDRPTVNYTAHRSELHIGTISEYNCSHKSSTVMGGAQAGAKFKLGRFQRFNSRLSDGIYGTVLRCNNAAATVDFIDIGDVQSDRLQHVCLIQNSVVGELSVDTLTTTDNAPIYIADSYIARLFWKSNSIPSYGLSSNRYTLGGISSVAFERPAPLGGSTAQRPVNAAYGDQFYDVTISKPIWWVGEWRDSAGTLV